MGHFGDAARKGHHLGVVREFLPAELGLADIDMTTQATNTGLPIDLAGFNQVTVCLEYVIVGTTPTVGKADIDVKINASDGTLIVPATEALTVSSTDAAGTYQVSASWGIVAGVAALDALVLTNNVEIILDIPTASDAGTSHTGNVYLFASK
jgi:hypothetical protein